jgi:transposase
MHAIVHGADMQDRDGGALLMASLFGAFPFLLKLYADGGYQGPEFQAAMKRTMAQVNVEIVKRSDCAKGFVVLPKRWLVTDRTMLPVWALSGPRSSNARAVVGGRFLLR